MQIADALVRYVADTKDLEKSMGPNGPIDKAAGKGATSVGSRFKSALGGVSVAAGAAGGSLFVAAIGGATAFEEQMRTVNTVAKLPDATLKALGNDVIDLSKETGKSTDDLTSGLYDLVSAGVPADKAIAVLRDSAKFATGALGTTGEAVDLVTSALNAYGLESTDSTKVTDIFAQAVADGKVTASELGSSISQIAPIAAAAGVSLEEVSAGFAVMTAKGTPAAQAATQMRSALTSIIKPNADLNAIQKKTGINFAELAKTKGLQAALEALSKATGGNAAEMTGALGSVEAYQFALAATGDNAAAFTTELGKVTDAAEKGGVAQQQYDEIQKSAGAQGRKLTATMKGLALQIGGPFVESMGPAVSALGGMGQGLTGIFSISRLAGAGLGGLAGKVIPLLLTSVGAILPAIGGAVTALGSAMAALIPIGMALLPVLLVAALVAAIIFLANNPEIVAKIVSFAQGAVQFIVDAFGTLVNALPGIIGAAFAAIASFLPTLVGGVVSVILSIPGKLVGLIGSLLGLWVQIEVAIVRLVVDLAGKVVGFLMSIPGKLFALGGNIVSTIISGLATLPGKLADVVRNAFAGLKIDVGPFHISGKGVSIDLPKIDLPHFDVGSSFVPADMLAMVHRGEIIIPATEAQAIRSGRLSVGTPPPAAPAAAAGVGGQRPINVIVNNPKPEPASTSVQRRLQSLAAFGVL